MQTLIMKLCINLEIKVFIFSLLNKKAPGRELFCFMLRNFRKASRTENDAERVIRIPKLYIGTARGEEDP